MDTEQIRRWREADRWFAAWLDQDESGRDAWLEKQSLAAETHEALSQLIHQHQGSDPSFPILDRIARVGPMTPLIRNQLAGRRIGHWTLLEEIGRGGMSVVYKARRSEADFEQLAAVKLLSLAALGSEGSARFEQERRLLARLRHPHIAALIDGGFADDGTPFLAMTLVEGETLKHYCEHRQLDWRQCARLLIQICDAVAHAHRNLMVHRDLKPANIMVTAQGVPVLLDFGIAKLLDDTHHDTRTGMRAMTPGYAAPEQMQGGQITTATDVYALGVILRTLCVPASALPQDLNNIIAMAMREDAARRYPDARALGEDLERLLQQHAVLATPDSTGYRLRAFLRRRRGLAIATAAVALALLAGLGLALWQAQRASRQAEEALRQAARAQAARDFLFSMIAAGDRERSEALDPPVSTVIARGIATLQDAPLTDPELHAEMATLLGHIDISIGQHQRAAELLDTAMKSAERAGDSALIADVWIRQGMLANARGEPDQAIRLFEAAMGHASTLRADRREALLTSSLSGWAYAMTNVGRVDDAHARIQSTLDNPDLIRSADRRAELLLTQSTVTRDPQTRLDLLLNAERHYAEKMPTPADRLVLANMLGASYGQLGRNDDALRKMQEAADLADRIHPGNTSRRARAYNNLGTTLSSANRMGEADAALAVAENIYRAVGDHGSPAFAALVHNRGVMLRDLGIAENALPLIEQAYAMAREQFGDNDRRTVVALRNLAFTRTEDGANAQADQEWREAQRNVSASWPIQDRYALMLIGAHVAAVLGNSDAAAARLTQADALATAELPEMSATLRVRRMSIGARLLSLTSKYDEATTLFEHAEKLAAETGVDAWSAAWRNHLAFAEHLNRGGHSDRANAHYAETLALLEARGAGLDSKLRQRLRELSKAAPSAMTEQSRTRQLAATHGHQSGPLESVLEYVVDHGRNREGQQFAELGGIAVVVDGNRDQIP